MTFTEMHEAIADAKANFACADAAAAQMAKMLIGRLRKVESGWILADLKKELRAFNITTKSWKEQ